MTYTVSTDYGGELSISLVGSVGADLTVAGMTDDELDDMFGLTPTATTECPPPRMRFGALYGMDGIFACVPNVTLTSPTGCLTHARLYLDLTTQLVDILLTALPEDYSENTISGATSDGPEGIAASGEYSTVVALSGWCLGDQAYSHEVTVVWDFPLHDERELEEVLAGDEACNTPDPGGGWW